MAKPQPIETAPKDGREVLLWTTFYSPMTGDEISRWDIGHWRVYPNGASEWASLGMPCEPTHWAPLPERPDSGAQEPGRKDEE